MARADGRGASAVPNVLLERFSQGLELMCMICVVRSACSGNTMESVCLRLEAACLKLLCHHV